MIDLVFPDKNEARFIRIAEKLGYSSLCLVYDYKKNIKTIKEKINQEQQKTKVKLFFVLLVDVKNVSKAKKISNFVLVKSSGDDQAVFEKSKPDMVYELESIAKKDKLNFRLSGLNQVLCRLAAKNKILVGFSFSSILNAKNRPLILGRIMQNIDLCRKFKVITVFASFAETPFEMRAWHDLMSFLIVLGIHSSKAKSSLKSAEEKIILNEKKKMPDYIREGVEVIK